MQDTLGTLEPSQGVEMEEDTVLDVSGYLDNSIRTLPFKTPDEIKKAQNEALNATGRIVANSILALADWFPGIGYLVQGEKVLRALGLNLLPDVNTKTSDGCLSLFAELFTGGVMPTYTPDAIRQALKDIPRIGDGIKVTLDSRKAERRDFQQHAPEIITAAKPFGVEIKLPVTKPPVAGK